MKYFALVLAFLLAFAPSAFAQPTDARVQVLKSQLEGFIENQKAMAAKNNCRLDTKGNVTVEQANGYYAFTLPDITYTDAKGVRSELGMIAINAVPEGANDWKITLALPTPISSFNKQGGEEVRTDIGSQNASGVWNEKLGHFTSINATLGNIHVNHLIDQSTITIGELKLASSMTEKDPEAYTGSAKAILSNISVFDANTTFKGTIPTITFDTNLADRAEKTAMTKDQIKNRQQASYPDGFNIFSFLLGSPELVQAKATGLDDLNMQMQQAMITAKPEQRDDYLKMILGVSAASGMGRPVPGDASSKSYDIVFGQNGAITINGADISTLGKVKKSK